MIHQILNKKCLHSRICQSSWFRTVKSSCADSEITNTCFDTDSEKYTMRSSAAESSKGQRRALLRDKGLCIHFNCCYTSAVAYPREENHVTADDLT